MIYYKIFYTNQKGGNINITLKDLRSKLLNKQLDLTRPFKLFTFGEIKHLKLFCFNLSKTSKNKLKLEGFIKIVCTFGSSNFVIFGHLETSNK